MSAATAPSNGACNKSFRGLDVENQERSTAAFVTRSSSLRSTANNEIEERKREIPCSISTNLVALYNRSDRSILMTKKP